MAQPHPEGSAGVPGTQRPPGGVQRGCVPATPHLRRPGHQEVGARSARHPHGLPHDRNCCSRPEEEPAGNPQEHLVWKGHYRE